MKTLTRRVALPLMMFLVWAPAANAWSWPIQGPLLQGFSYDQAHPYASGQHRGIDIGADGAGEGVAAPAAGTVTFAGTVPTNGKSLTIQTADGYSVTLTHLGSILVAKGAVVAEEDAVGTVGPSGTPELGVPYVHLGIRVTADPNGYVDPLGLLPPTTESGGTGSDPTASQPSSSGAASSPAASEPSGSSPATPASVPAPPVPAAPRVVTTRGSTIPQTRPRVSVHEHERAQGPRTDVRTPRAAEAPVTHPAAPAQRRRPRKPARSSRQPAVETTASAEPTGLGAGDEVSPSSPIARPETRRQRPAGTWLALLCNGAGALVALLAALGVARGRRRRRLGTSAVAAAEVLHLPRRETDRRPVSRAA